jgi:hypothetical protein
MFRRGRFWHRGRIYSDEGFSVGTGGRDSIVYREADRKMTITVVEGYGIYEETIGRWDDNPTEKIGGEERSRIATNLKRALESQGLPVYFVEQEIERQRQSWKVHASTPTIHDDE